MPLNYLAPPDEEALEEDEDAPNTFDQELRDTDVPPLAVAPPPPGYVAANQTGAMEPDVSVAPIGEAPPPAPSTTYPVFVAGRQGPNLLKVPQASSRSIIPPVAAAPAAINEIGDTDLPVAGAMPAPAKRVIGQDKTLQGAQETARQHLATMPVRPVPKWWERALAGAVGGAAGWSNAARRAAPIDIAKATEPLLYPGYDQKLASWQSEQEKANQQVANLGQQVSAQYASQKAQSDAQLKAAQTQMDIEHGTYWLKRSDQERNQWKFGTDGSVLNTITGQVVTRPPTAAARYAAAMSITGGDKEKSQYYALNGKLPAPTSHNVSEWQSYLDANGGDSAAALKAKQANDIHKAIASRDPSMADYRNYEKTKQTEDTANKINNTRNEEERRIHSDMDAKLSALSGAGRMYDPVLAAQIKKDAAISLQNMQTQYAQAIRQSGGSADEFNVDPVTLQWLPKTAPGNPYGNAANPFQPGAAAPAARRPLDGR